MKDKLDTPIFDIYSPLSEHCIGVLSIPHSGEIIPDEFEAFLVKDKKVRDRDVDYGVHELIEFEELRKAGILIIKSNIHRICVDLNRAADKCVLNWKSNSHGEPLVIQEPDAETTELLIGKYHAPYYQTLRSTIEVVQEHFEKKFSKEKRSSFVDLHSMPSKPTAYHLKQNPNQAMSRPDFCNSDQHGVSCDAEYINYVTDLFKEKYNPAINNPYVGGHITQYFMHEKVNNIQIEINRALYMNEESRTFNTDKKDVLKRDLTDILIKHFKKFYN